MDRDRNDPMKARPGTLSVPGPCRWNGTGPAWRAAGRRVSASARRS